MNLIGYVDLAIRPQCDLFACKTRGSFSPWKSVSSAPTNCTSDYDLLIDLELGKYQHH